jgi:hypothetical protein
LSIAADCSILPVRSGCNDDHTDRRIGEYRFKGLLTGRLTHTPIQMIITSTLVHTDLHHSQVKPLVFVWPHVQHLPDPRQLCRSHRSVQTDIETKPSIETPASESGPDVTTPGGSRIMYYLKMLIRFTFEGTENNMILDVRGKGVGTFFKRLLWTALQGVMLGVIIGFPLWCLAIVILGPIYRMNNMGNRWAPQVSTGRGCIRR